MEGSTKLMIKLKAGNGQFDNISLVIKTICIPQTKGCRIFFSGMGSGKNTLTICGRRKRRLPEVRQYYGGMNRVWRSIVPELILRETDKQKEIPSTQTGSTEGTVLGNLPT